MAYYELEPFGEMVADRRHGVAAALLANINRSEAHRPTPWGPDDFIDWRETDVRPEDDEPTLLDDPVAQADLFRAAVFGIAPKG